MSQGHGARKANVIAGLPHYGTKAMGQVTVTLNGRTYRMSCADGEEQRLHMLVDHIREKLGSLTEQFGKIGNERLMLMAAILVTDELFEVREDKDTGVD
ncbi:MAG: cell division protein ZapA [Pseudomonadota bacterium]